MRCSLVTCVFELACCSPFNVLDLSTNERARLRKCATSAGWNLVRTDARTSDARNYSRVKTRAIQVTKTCFLQNSAPKSRFDKKSYRAENDSSSRRYAAKRRDSARTCSFAPPEIRFRETTGRQYSVPAWSTAFPAPRSRHGIPGVSTTGIPHLK